MLAILFFPQIGNKLFVIVGLTCLSSFITMQTTIVRAQQFSKLIHESIGSDGSIL
jgi:hypothetical protein